MQRTLARHDAMLASRYPWHAASASAQILWRGPLETLAAGLPKDLVAAAQARGQELDPWQAVEALLAELAELGWETPEAK